MKKLQHYANYLISNEFPEPDSVYLCICMFHITNHLLNSTTQQPITSPPPDSIDPVLHSIS